MYMERECPNNRLIGRLLLPYGQFGVYPRQGSLGLGEIRPERGRNRILLHRLGQKSLRLQADSQPVVDPGHRLLLRGAVPQRRRQRRHRAVVHPQLLLRQPEIILRFPVPLIVGHRPDQMLAGLAVVPLQVLRLPLEQLIVLGQILAGPDILRRLIRRRAPNRRRLAVAAE